MGDVRVRHDDTCSSQVQVEEAATEGDKEGRKITTNGKKKQRKEWERNKQDQEDEDGGIHTCVEEER